jgi:glycerophosphoryl diester phosphodiesterase
VSRRRLFAAALVLVGVAARMRSTARPGRARPAVLRGAPLLIGHRGAAALAPENTLPSLHSALDDWRADMVEIDVRASADGHCVVIHDATVDRTTDGTGAVRALSLDALRRLDAGYRFAANGGFPFRGRGVRVPTVDEVFAAFPRARFTIEVKSGDAQAPLFDAIDRFDASDRVVIGGMRDADRSLFADRHHGATSPSIEQLRVFGALQFVGLGALARIPGDVVQVPEYWRGRRIVTRTFVAAVHRQGVDVHVWTVNERGAMERLLDLGVDGIVTDRPDLLDEVLRARGRAPTASTAAGSAPAG